ncbi:GNAT family N-acetyltransferase [Nocardioides sp. Root140]|uniref:GNAT family N-acetyltransferase n=1 Tax=Nocardioides sp. Root140 TaxID=1736460 RepID=UPI0006F340D7|nr:GNAT family N-acetyltransferase [Nocardioides sp. Root140]KQY57559.1 hypothetical protein ASD30_15395 [Nocardioides sp. Root140]
MTITLNARLALRPVHPESDGALLHGWVTEERARFWGMLERPLDEVIDIYTYIQEQPHLAAYLVCWDDEPWALFQTYDPAVDEIGEFYDRRPGDVGVHLLMGPGRRPDGFSEAMFTQLPGWVFSDPGVQRIVLEPDARNNASVSLMPRIGARLGPQVEMPQKTAQFAFIERSGWTAPSV